MREAISGLMRREHTTLPEILYPDHQDVYDHILRVSESTDSLRELVSTIVETNISLRDYRQNQVMKKVTSWAAIVAVPTLITGWYGQNVPYPAPTRPGGCTRQPASASPCPEACTPVPMRLALSKRGADFVSGDPAYPAPMTMNARSPPLLEPQRLNITADDVPDGISAEDHHRAGLASSLTNLVRQLER